MGGRTTQPASLPHRPRHALDRSESAAKVILETLLNRNPYRCDQCRMRECTTMHQHAAAVARFSTDDIASRDRVAIWREALVRTVLKFDVEPASEAPFRAHATVRAFPGLRLISGASSAADFRSERKPADTDEVVLSICQSNVFARQQDGDSLIEREASIGSGDGFLMLAGSRAHIHVAQDGEFACLRVPRATLAAKVANLDSAFCRPIARATPALRLLKRYLGVFDDAATAFAAPGVQHAAVTHIYDLLALTLGATRDVAEVAEGRGARAARLKAIKDDIFRNLHEPALSVGVVAQRYAVTPRHVQKLFEEDGATFTQYLVSQRLARAQRLLTNPQRRDHTTTSIAREVGFADLSYFNRAFRRQFGMSPSDARRSASES
jgi:AraC-like DNA-binding protein